MPRRIPPLPLLRLSITVDTTAPTITPGTPDLAAADDTGYSDTDNKTKEDL